MNHLSTNPFDAQRNGKTADQVADMPVIGRLIRDRGILI